MKKRRSISLLLSLMMVMTVIGGSIIPAAAETPKVLIEDDYSTLASGADLGALGWTVDSAANNGTMDGTGSSLKIQRNATGEMTGIKSLEHYEREFAANGTEEETRTAVRSSHLKGIYDIEFTAKYGNLEGGNGVWIDFYGRVLGFNDSQSDTKCGRLRADNGGITIYNNKINTTDYAKMYSPATEYKPVRLRMNTTTGTFQMFLDGSTTAAVTTTALKPEKSGDTFPMTSWNAHKKIYYMADKITFNAAKTTTGFAELQNFKVSEVEKDTSSVVEQAIAGLTIDQLTADPANVTGAVTLPDTVGGVTGIDTITWESSNAGVISADGQTVTQQNADTDVVLTAKITETDTGFTKYKEFKLTVPALEGASDWEQVLNMQLGSGDSEYTVTQAGDANLEITSTPENHLQVKAKKNLNYDATKKMVFEVPLKKNGGDFVMDQNSSYYFEVTAVDGLTNGQFYANVVGKKEDGQTDGTHSAFIFNNTLTNMDISKKDTADGGVNSAHLGTHQKKQDYTFGYIINTTDGQFTVYEGDTNKSKLGGPYFPNYGGVDIRSLKCEFKNWLNTGDYVQLVSIKAYKWNGQGTPTAPPGAESQPTESPVTPPTDSPAVTPGPVDPPDGDKVVYQETFSGAEIDPATNMAKGWSASDEMKEMAQHSVEDGALKVTKTAAANASDNGEKLTMNYPLKVYDAPYDASTHSAVYTDELFGKYRLELNVKPHITGAQLAAVGFSKKNGSALAKGAGVSLKKNQADVWIATGDTRVVETGGTPNDKYNQIIYTLDTNNTAQWTVQFGDLTPRVLDQNWGGLAGIYLGMKPSNDAGEYIMLKSAKIYEVEKYDKPEEAALNEALANLTIADLTDTPDAVVSDLKALPPAAGSQSVTWTSSHPEVISDQGAVTRPVGDDVEVVLTAKVTNSISKYKEFHVTVKGETDPEKILAAAAEKVTFADLTNEDPVNITRNLKSLPANGAYGTTITWTSSDTSVMQNDGTLVTLGENAKLPVTMTATFSYGGKTLEKKFPLQIGIDFSRGLVTLYETDFSGATVASNIDQVPGVGKIKQEGGKLLLDRTGTNGGTGTTVRIHPALGDENLKITGEMILEADVHLPADCEKVEIIPYDDAGNRIFTIYSGKAGGGQGYTYVNRTTETGSAVHTRVESTKTDLTIKLKAQFNLDTKRLTLQIDDNDGNGMETVVDNKWIREDASCLSYIEINGVDNTVQSVTHKNTGVVEINKVKLTVNKGYIPQYIVDSVDYYSAITKLNGFVSGDIALNTKALPGTTVIWSSNKPEVVANDGTFGDITQDVPGVVMTFRLEMADDPNIYVEKVFDPLTAIYIPKGNLAFGKNAKANVGSRVGSGPENAVDGNVGTNWETAKWTNSTDPALTIDFGQVQVFNQIMLKEAKILEDYPLRAFVLETSTDGKNFTELSKGQTLGEAVTFIPVKQTMARYVRFRVTQKVATSNVGLAEFQVYLNGGESAKVAADLLVLKYQLGSLMGLSSNVELPPVGALYGSKFVYTSSDTSALTNDGTVIRTKETKSGTLRVDAYAKTGEDANGNPVYQTAKGGEESLPFSVSPIGGSSGGGGGGTPVGRPSGGSGGGGAGAALPTGPSVNSGVGNETGSQTTGSFRDVTRDYWGFNYIETLKSHQIVDGDEQGNFNPEAQITREEFLKMLMNALGIATNDIKDVTLSDVSSSDWCYPYIAKAIELGITSGISETEFGAGRSITREDMAVLATRALKAANRTLSPMENSKTFTDGAQISGYAQESVKQMQQAGIIGGYDDGSFGPQQNASRGEAAKIICGIMN